MGSAHRIESAGQSLGRAEERLRLGTGRAVERAEAHIAGTRDSVEQAAGLGVERQAAAIDRMAQAVALNAARRIEIAGSQIDRDREQAARAVAHRIVLAASRLDDLVGWLARGAEASRRDAATRVESFVQRIVGLGPQATLRRGYAIARDRGGRPLGTRRQAEGQPMLELQFQDGRLRVENRAVPGEPAR